MDDIKLRVYDGIALAGFFMIPCMFFTTPSDVLELGGSAAWISTLLAHTLILIIFWVTAKASRDYGGKNVIAVTSEVFGKPAGAFCGSLLSLYFCFFTGIFIRESAEILKIYSLPLTPVYVIAGIIAGAAIALNMFGGRPVVKTAGFFFIIIVFVAAIILLLGVNRYNTDYLFPVLGGGVNGIAAGGRHMASMTGSALVLTVFAADFKSDADYRRSGVIAISMSAALSVLFYLCVVMTFSANIASDMLSGFMELGKSIYYNHFLYRFESFLLFILIFSAVITSAAGIYAARKSAGTAFSSLPGKISSAACFLITVLAAVIPQSMLDLTNRYLGFIWRYGIFFTASFPLLLFAALFVKRIIKHEKV